MTGKTDLVLHLAALGQRPEPAAGHLRGVRRAGLVARRCTVQAEDRAHRIGQTGFASVLLSGSVQGGSDREMQDALGLKVSQFVGLMGDTPQSEADALLGAQEARQHVERLVQRLLNQTA